MRRKLLTTLFEFAYRRPAVFRTAHRLLFGGRIKIWREISALEIPLVESRVLELGCGMNPAIGKGVGLDYSLPLLKAIAKRPYLDRVGASARALPFGKETFGSALAVFPPGISADHGFFHRPEFWAELNRVLVPGGEFIALVCVSYRHPLWRLATWIIDPLPADFWKKTQELAAGFEVEERERLDPWGNRLVFARVIKSNR